MSRRRSERLSFPARATKLVLCGIVCVSLPANALACDLSHLDVPTHFPDTVPFGSRNIKVDTRLGLDFELSGPGSYLVRRTDVTYLLDISDQIAADVADADKNLPKNDCNLFARIASQQTSVNTPAYLIHVFTEASAWTCSPVLKVPCPKLNLNDPGTVSDSQVEASSLYHRFESTKTETPIVLAQFSIPNPFNPSHPINTPVPIVPPGPLNPPPNPLKPSQPLHPVPIQMCDTPRVKTKLGGGTVVSTIALNPSVASNVTKISTAKTQEAHLDTQANFVLGLLAGPSLGILTSKAIGKGLESLASKNMTLVPDQISIPGPPRQKLQLIWITTTAEFESRSYLGKMLPALVVKREYRNTRENTACFIRDFFQNL